MRGTAKCYDKLREYCESVPIVDCHDHTGESGPKHEDPVRALICGYFPSDIWSAGGDKVMEFLNDSKRPLAQRWRAVEKAWKRTEHTGYARVTKLVLKKFYGEDNLTLATLKRIKGKLLDLSNEKKFESILEEAKIVARLEDTWPDVSKVLDGTLRMSPRGRLMIGLPGYHNVRDYTQAQNNVGPLGTVVTSLDEYIACCRKVFEGYKKYGAVGFKDQSAYTRSVDYGNPTRAEAEQVFNWFIQDPRRSASWPDQAQPLSDFLFHEFMRMARDMDLPVQIHTGHMAGIRNDIIKTNAAGLTKLLELHREVQFDLFHANWPYDDELMYLGKNFPNVSVDFCWANIIDPMYCQNLYKRALTCMPHGKIHGYGSDFGGNADRAWAHAHIARDNIAIALSDMVEIGYLGSDEAKEVAKAWLFGNANEFFRLGLEKKRKVKRRGK